MILATKHLFLPVLRSKKSQVSSMRGQNEGNGQTYSIRRGGKHPVVILSPFFLLVGITVISFLEVGHL
jgi:hypothetical protein